jgi:hypothetical protein
MKLGLVFVSNIIFSFIFFRITVYLYYSNSNNKELKEKVIMHSFGIIFLILSDNEVIQSSIDLMMNNFCNVSLENYR